MDKFKNSDNKMILNNENYYNQQNQIIQNEYEKEKKKIMKLLLN